MDEMQISRNWQFPYCGIDLESHQECFLDRFINEPFLRYLITLDHTDNYQLFQHICNLNKFVIKFAILLK